MSNAYNFAQSVKYSQAFNMPKKQCKQVWGNQYGNGYIFNDGSYLKFFKRSSGNGLFWGSLGAYTSKNGTGECATMLLTKKCMDTRIVGIAK